MKHLPRPARFLGAQTLAIAGAIVATCAVAIGPAAAAEPEQPSAECRYALQQARADPKADAKARTCRERCAAFPGARASCPKAAAPPALSPCELVHPRVMAQARPEVADVVRCVEQCAGRFVARGDACLAKAAAVCHAASEAADAAHPDAEALGHALDATDERAAELCRQIGRAGEVDRLGAFRLNARACLAPPAGASAALTCAACAAARAGAVRPDCQGRTDTPPGPTPAPTSGALTTCRARWLEARHAWALGNAHPAARDACVSACSGTGDRDAERQRAQCVEFRAEDGRIALVRLAAPLPAPSTLEPGSGTPVLVPWLGVLENERRGLAASGWALQAGLGAHGREGAIRSVDSEDQVQRGSGVGGLFEGRALVRARVPGFTAEADTGLELRTLPEALGRSSVGLERAHLALALGGALDGVVAAHSQLDFVMHLGARRMPAMGIDVRGTPFLWSLGLGWSELGASGSGVLTGLEIDGADYGRFQDERGKPVGLRLPLVLALGLSGEAPFKLLAAASFAPRWLDEVGWALPAWATIGASGCISSLVCADVGLDAGVRAFTVETDGGLEGGPYYELPLSVILRAKALLAIHLDSVSTAKVGVMVDPVRVAVPAEEDYKRPHPILMALLLADAPLAWNGASYTNGGYYHGGVLASAGLDLPALPLMLDVLVDIQFDAPTGLGVGARIPLGPVELGLRYRGTAMSGGGYEYDLMATLGVDFRGAIDP